MHKWSHLANARHIDWVLESLERDPRAWHDAWLEVSSDPWEKAWQEARDLIVRDPYRNRAWNAAYEVIQNSTSTWTSSWSSIIALIAWDDLDHCLNLQYKQLKLMAVLSERPEAVLLLPMIYVRERIYA